MFKLGNLINRLLMKVGVKSRKSVSPGISLFGFNFYKDIILESYGFRASAALKYAINLRPKKVIDIGSGGGEHALQFLNVGSDVLCIDYGTSIYAKNQQSEQLTVLKIDFNDFIPEKKFDLVWASHVLEHQLNVNIFIEKLNRCCSEDGHICITVPDFHRDLWGGHLTLWTPALLAYNVVMCGIDLSNAKFIRGINEFSIIYTPNRILLPKNLTYDKGDINLLKEFLPNYFYENMDPWDVEYINKNENH